MTVTKSKDEVHPAASQEALPDPLFGLLSDAVREAASDVHVDAWGNQAAVRFRVDGSVCPREPLSYDEARRLVNQIKVAAGLNLAGHWLPQEGHFRWINADHDRGIRATVLSTSPNHEAAHLRLLTPPEQWRDVRNLGLESDAFQHVEEVFRAAHGLVLVTGPTGSGKTTTLYSLTGLTDLRGQVATSIEDPVEFDLPYVRQLEVDEERGLTLEEGLRTLLRVDPDIVMVGEIRDTASATIAARAALAGRLVMATVHGRDPATAIAAMHYLSVPYYVLGGSLRLVIAQDLIRKVCPACFHHRPLEPHERQLFEQASVPAPDEVFDAVGCPECFGHGYRGRTGVFQVASIDDEFGGWLAQGRRPEEIRERLAAAGSRTIVADALEKAAAGVTSMSEVLRFYGQKVDRPLVLHPQVTQ
jgi:type II secretory ATPase GspE/PulE/Tfp pilus assembly ATPase PilB-like protein